MTKPKIAIIGGGIIGMVMAYQLSNDYQVSIFDTQKVGQEASWAGGGILSPLYFWRYQETVLRLAQNAVADYQTLGTQLMDETGIDIEFKACELNILDMLTATELHNIGQQSYYSITPKSTDAGTSKQGITTDYISAQAGQIRNPRLLSALKQSLIQRGVNMIEHHNVEFESAKRRVAVKGFPEFEQVILSSGAWTNTLLKPMDMALDINPIRGQILAYQFKDLALENVWMNNGVYLIPRQDNILLVGSTLEDVGFDKSITEEAKQVLYAEAENICPSITEATLVKQWAGLRPASKDNIPTIANVPGYNNLWINAGHFRYGITMALNSAKIMRHLLETGEYPAEFKQDAHKLSF